MTYEVRVVDLKQVIDLERVYLTERIYQSVLESQPPHQIVNLVFTITD